MFTTLWKNCVGKQYNRSRTTFHNAQFQEIRGFHNLQSIISLNDSDKLEKSLQGPWLKIQVLEQHMLPSSKDVPAYFSKTMPRYILHVLQQRGFEVKEFRYWTGQPAVKTCLPLRMCGAL